MSSLHHPILLSHPVYTRHFLNDFFFRPQKSSLCQVNSLCLALRPFLERGFFSGCSFGIPYWGVGLKPFGSTSGRWKNNSGRWKEGWSNEEKRNWRSIRPNQYMKTYEEHGVWKSHEESHPTLRAKWPTFTFWVDKSSLKMPKMVNLESFLKIVPMRYFWWFLNSV